MNKNSPGTYSMAALVADEDFFMTDLIIGPFHRSNYMKAAEFAKTIKRPIISPVPLRNDILKDNPYTIKVHSSSEAQVDYLRHFALTKWRDKNLILLENNELKDVVLCERFQGIIHGDTNQAMFDTINSLVKRVKMYEFDTARLNSALHDSLEKIILMPLNSKTSIGSYLAGLNKYAKDYNIKIVGLDSWNKMGYLEYRYLNNLKVHTLHNQYVEYADTNTEKFIQRYKLRAETEPSSWAYLGYDMGKYFLSALAKYGTAFQNSFQEMPYRGISRDFYFLRNSPSSGFENKTMRMVKVENYQYQEIRLNDSE